MIKVKLIWNIIWATVSSFYRVLRISFFTWIVLAENNFIFIFRPNEILYRYSWIGRNTFVVRHLLGSIIFIKRTSFQFSFNSLALCFLLLFLQWFIISFISCFIVCHLISFSTNYIYFGFLFGHTSLNWPTLDVW